MRVVSSLLVAAFGVAACGLPMATPVLEPPEVIEDNHNDLAFTFVLSDQPAGFEIGYDFYYKWFADDSGGSERFDADIDHLSNAVITNNALNNHYFFRFRSPDRFDRAPAIPVTTEQMLKSRADQDGIQIDVYNSTGSKSPAKTIELYRWYAGAEDTQESQQKLRAPVTFAAGDAASAVPELDFSPSVQKLLKDARDKEETQIRLRLGLIVVAHGRSPQQMQPVYSPIVTPHYGSILYEVELQLTY